MSDLHQRIQNQRQGWDALNTWLTEQNRTLARVLLDIDTAEHEWARKMHTDEESDALDHLDALKAEARQKLEKLTGVSCDEIMKGVA